MRVALCASPGARARWPSALLLALSMSACGAAAPGSPEAALAELRLALERRDAAAAYRLMSRSYRARVPFAEFQAQVEHPDPEDELTIQALSELDGPAEIDARIPLHDGEVILHGEDGGFRVESDVIDFYSQLTPRAALRSFVRAAERRRYDVLLRLMPRRDREGFTEATLETLWTEQRERMERLVGTLRGGLDATLEVHGDRATLSGDGAHAVLVLEAGRWVIEDPD